MSRNRPPRRAEVRQVAAKEEGSVLRHTTDD